jgi:hypothetical protein
MLMKTYTPDTDVAGSLNSAITQRVRFAVALLAIRIASG